MLALTVSAGVGGGRRPISLVSTPLATGLAKHQSIHWIYIEIITTEHYQAYLHILRFKNYVMAIPLHKC